LRGRSCNLEFDGVISRTIPVNQEDEPLLHSEFFIRTSSFKPAAAAQAKYIALPAHPGPPLSF
jgi:hypothetical protein